jgi:hypothetical protein
MDNPLVREGHTSKANNELPTLKGILEELEIAPFTTRSVAEYKREKLEEVTQQLRPPLAEEIQEYEFSNWEYAELDRLKGRMTFRDLSDDSHVAHFWPRSLRKAAERRLSGDAPVIRFWKTSIGERFYTYVQWVRVPYQDVGEVPEFIQAKVDEISNRLPDATFTVEELRSERRAYDPFLIVSHGDECYRVEVWAESAFERRYT